MQSPTGCFDLELLNSEPFLSMFKARKIYCEEVRTRGARNDGAGNSIVAKAIQEDESASKAANDWLKLAFAMDGKKGRKGQNIRAATSDMEVFVQFYWLLYQEQSEEARTYLRSQRRKRGIPYEVDESSEATATNRIVNSPPVKPAKKPRRSLKSGSNHRAIESSGIDGEERRVDDEGTICSKGTSTLKSVSDVEPTDGPSSLSLVGHSDNDSRKRKACGSPSRTSASEDDAPPSRSHPQTIPTSSEVTAVANSTKSPSVNSDKSSSEEPLKAVATRWNPRRSAANHHRLAETMQKETAHEESIKRGALTSTKSRKKQVKSALAADSVSRAGSSGVGSVQSKEQVDVLRATSRSLSKGSTTRSHTQRRRLQQKVAGKSAELIRPPSPKRARGISGCLSSIMMQPSTQSQGCGVAETLDSSTASSRKEMLYEPVLDIGQPESIPSEDNTTGQSTSSSNDATTDTHIDIVTEAHDVPTHQTVVGTKRTLAQADADPVDVAGPAVNNKIKRKTRPMSQALQVTASVIRESVNDGHSVGDANTSIIHGALEVVQASNEANIISQDDSEDRADNVEQEDSTEEALAPNAPSQLLNTGTVSAPLGLPLSSAASNAAIHTQRIPKSPLNVNPHIWAESRQEVCESFDWFRSYQGGVYFSKDLVKGYLLSAFASKRDLFAHNGRLIISHGGGKAESIHSKEGQSTAHEASDQLAEDKSVRALLNTRRMGRPVVLLIDDKYPQFPYDLSTRKCTYAVLGFYNIVHAWAEREVAHNSRGYVVRYKFAFQWCGEQPKPWWITKEEDEAFCAESQPKDDVIPTCMICGQQSPIVYTHEWMCLNSKCGSFWKTREGIFPPEDLTYNEHFLRLSKAPKHQLVDLRPTLPVSHVVDGITTTRVFCKGWHCSECGRLTSRSKWEHWECASCGNKYTLPGRIRSPNEFWKQDNKLPFRNHQIGQDSGIIPCRTTTYQWNGALSNVQTFVLPGKLGQIHLILGRQVVNKEADEIFVKYQEQATAGELKFRRWPLRAHKCRGTLLTNYFSQNTGEPYQYVGGADNSVPWDQAPSAVSNALSLIRQRIEVALNRTIDFNEVLSCAYMEKQKMAFHSDAERGLGPVVASLSLGSHAFMHFRPLAKFDTKSGNGSNRNALSLVLRHGDVLVMEGPGIQQHYEHTVDPFNFRIAATARMIDPSNRSVIRN